jgi:conjugative relaxase-like TrwC/TraI family protein
MLSVVKLSPGQEFYYQRSVAAGLDDYFAGRGESPGIWMGRAAVELGLDGIVQDGQLARLVRGVHPTRDERLRKHPKKREITVERLHPETGERRTETKTLSPVAGFDLVFSCPKSVSLLHALGDEETRLAVNEAHRSAWQAALTYLEGEACITRRGRGGVEREHATGFVAAAYQHRTSRAQDPHLHTHVVVANVGRSPSDGKWRALDGDAILRVYRLAAGYLYQAQLRAELSRSLGVEWERPAKGMAEVKGVAGSVLREFSQRRRQVVERMAEWGTDGWRAAQAAARETRDRKDHVDLVRLREDWRARAAEHGLGQLELEGVRQRREWREASPGKLLLIARELLGPNGLTEQRTAFSEPELVMAWAQAHEQGTDAGRIRRICDRFLRVEGIEPVGAVAEPGRPARYSTLELIEVERAALAIVERGRGSGAPTVSEADLTQSVSERSYLSPEQAAMVRAVAGTRDRVVCVVGLAGAGKTTATHAVAEAFRAAGAPIFGAAPSGVAAERLQDETGIRSTTLHRLLMEAARRGGLPHGAVLVVDEAGMAETRILLPLLRQIESADGKAVLIGDPHQLPAVGAGGLFEAIVERYGAVELTENRRQRDELERDALAAVRDGLGRDWLAYAEGRGRLIVSDDPLTMRARLLADWWACAKDDPAANIMIALRRRDVAELNSLARELMDTHGKLGAERITFGGREFAPGDRVVCKRNSDALGVKNGARGTVVGVDTKSGGIHVRTDRGDEVALGRSYLEAGHVRHAYALTGHSGQGVTVERAFVLGSDEARLQEWGYVALSRAREATRLYITGSERERESHAPDIDELDPVARFSRALEESAIERLAIDQAPEPSGSKHNARAALDRPSLTPRRRAELRAIDQERRFVEQAHARVQRRREVAERALGSFEDRRGRPRNDLRREAESHRRALERMDTALADLDRVAIDIKTSAIRDTERTGPAGSIELGL